MASFSLLLCVLCDLCGKNCVPYLSIMTTTCFLTCLWTCLFNPISLFFSPILADEAAWLMTIRCHHVLGDYKAACTVVKKALSEYPCSRPLLALAVKSYVGEGLIAEALKAWRKGGCDEALLEAIAWGVLEEGIGHASPPIRLLALAGAAQTGGQRAISLIKGSLEDHSALVRAVACQLAGQQKAASLAPMLMRLIEQEHCWQVRCAAIGALGELSVQEATSLLLRTAASPIAVVEERHVTAAALVLIQKSAAEQFVRRLACEKSAAYRLLACDVAIFGHCGSDALLPLLTDPSLSVQAAALQTLGLLRTSWKLNEETLALIIACSKAKECSVAASAAWFLTLEGFPEGPATFERLLQQQPATARCAAAALAATGARGIAFLEKALATAKDQSTMATMAIGLLGQRRSVKKAALCLSAILKDTTVRWRWQQFGIFRALAPNQGEEELAGSSLVDAAVRLELLNLLAITDPVIAMPPLRQFLQVRTSGVSAAAAALLLTEGDDSAINLVQELLTNANTAHQRLQASLILALWGRNEDAIAPLFAAYKSANRTAKEQILAALGHIGTKQSLPFLTEVLENPSPSLRIHAAAALLEALSQ